MVAVIDGINKAVSEENAENLMLLLKSPCLKSSTPLYKEEKQLYLRLLKKRLVHKESQNLWLDDIVDIINEVNSESLKVKELTEALVLLNQAVLNNNVDGFWNAFSCPLVSNSANIDESYKDVYFQMFSKALKKRGHQICPWIVCHTDAGNTVYIDVESYTYSWSTPKDFVPYARYLTKKDVNVLIEKTNRNHINKYKQMVIENSIVKLQAYCRGYLLRQRYIRRLCFFKDNVEYIIKIQSWWRQVSIRRKYETLIKMKTIEAKLKRERQQNPWAWYKIQVKYNIFGMYLCIYNTYLGSQDLS